jgi:hypothetical protein
MRTIVIIVCVLLLLGLLHGIVDPHAARQAHQNAVEAFTR